MAEMEHVSKVVSRLRKAHASGKTKPLQWRRDQLQKIINIVVDHEEELLQALKDDLNKPKVESMVLELNYAKNDAINAYNNLADWIKPVKASKGLEDITSDCYYRREPYGVALILGAWNYPVQLVLCPLIGAIAAGNCALIKPSEIAQTAGPLMEKLITQHLDNECIAVINGGIPETTSLLKEKFDMIFYTGCNTVGKIIMRAAAENLTPVILELGGKSPVYVDRDCDFSVVANRIMWGKCTNSGQTCIAPDYVMCHPKDQDELVRHFKNTLQVFYGDDPQKTNDYGRIIDDRHFERLSKLVEGSENIAIGGQMDKDERYISPTIITDVKVTDPLMESEIFGPILPILPVQSPTDAIEIINSIDKPLALYIFSDDKTTVDTLINNTDSGGICVNDTVVHAGPLSLPFGGVGHSGMGVYHGKFSFDAFSHLRSCLHKNLKMEGVNSIRYPPFTEKKLGWVTWLLRKKQKRTGVMSFLPFMLVGMLIAVAIKTTAFMG